MNKKCVNTNEHKNCTLKWKVTAYPWPHFDERYRRNYWKFEYFNCNFYCSYISTIFILQMSSVHNQ